MSAYLTDISHFAFEYEINADDDKWKQQHPQTDKFLLAAVNIKYDFWLVFITHRK